MVRPRLSFVRSSIMTFLLSVDLGGVPLKRDPSEYYLDILAKVHRYLAKTAFNTLIQPNRSQSDDNKKDPKPQASDGPYAILSCTTLSRKKVISSSEDICL